MLFAGDVELPKLSSPPTSAELQTLKARRLDLAQKAYADALSRLKMGTGTVESAFTWSQRWADAEREADPHQAAARAIDRAKLIEGLARERVATGTLPASAANEALWWRAEVELEVAAQPH
jgi:hypothetical protein